MKTSDIEIVDASKKRTKKAKKNVILMFIIRGISMGISFLYIPLLLHSLDTVNYAVWLTITSMVSWITMFDVGLGNGLRNKLSIALSNKNYVECRHLVSTAYCCLGAFATALCLLFISVYNFIPWGIVLNINNGAIIGLNQLILIVFIAFCIQFALGLINSVLFALQLPALSSGILMIGQLLSFISVYIMTKIGGITSLLALGTIISVIPPIVLLISSIIIFKYRYNNIAPSIKLFRKEYITEILSVGIKFFILQLITIALYQTNNLIIIHAVGDAAVVDYNIAYKYMHVLSMLFTIIVTPIWSATTEAYALGDINWIKRINKQLIKTAGIFSIIGIIMLILSPYAYHIWLSDNNIQISYITTGLLLIQTIFFILYSSYGYMLNGIGKLKAQMWFTSAFAIAYIPAAIIFGRIWGLNGVLIAFAANAFLNVAWSKTQFNKIINGTAHGIWAE